MTFSLRDLSHSLADVLETGELRLTPRPYDLHRARSSLWWLVPSTAWPAYRHGKLFVSIEEDGSLHIGLHLERGLGLRGVKGYNASKELLMTADWAWRSALDEILLGDLGDDTAQVRRISPYPLGVQLTTRFPDTSKVATAQRREGAVHWHCSGDGLEQAGGTTLPHEAREGLLGAQSFSAIVRAIESNTQTWDFLWCNLFVGLIIPPDSLGTLQAHSLAPWLEPWLRWVR